MGPSLIIGDEFDKLLGGDSSAQPTSEEGKQFADEYAKGVDALPDDVKAFAFKNVIQRRDICGFAGGGRKDYLINTDPTRRYRVTVRTYWSQGINSGQSDNIHIMDAGSEKYLGCTDSGAIPVAYYNRQVVGESSV
jgi:hypothetical protein